MFKKLKGLLSLFICISMLSTVMPIKIFAAEGDVASVTFDGNTTYYTTIDEAWAAAVALDTTEENKATIKLLADCKAENTLTNTADYLVLDTNGKKLTTPDAIHSENDILCGISAEGGSLEITGNGTISGISLYSYARGILLVNGGEVYLNGVTIRNNGGSAGIAVRVAGGTFHLLDGYLISASEYALYAAKGKAYLYSGKIESKGRLAMAADETSLDVQICYSDKPLYFVDNSTDNWGLISSMRKVHLADNLIMDLEYSDNSDGSDSTTLKNVTEISGIANDNRNYLKIQTYKTSYLFSTKYGSTLLSKIKNDGVTELTEDTFTAVHFVDLEDYDLTSVTCSDYSASGDGSVKAWVSGTELYIGGNGKIIAGKSLLYAFEDGKKIDRITGLERLCTSNVTNMGWMFYYCGSSSPTFMPDLGDKFDTSCVTDMYQMFVRCGYSNKNFTIFDLSGFTIGADTNLNEFARDIPATKFIFGKGWRNATMPTRYNYFASCSSDTPTEIVGATKNVLSYDWASNKRTVTFTDNVTYTITPVAEDGGTVSGGGTVLDGGSMTLNATANDGYIFDGWYDGDTRVCETEEFVIEDAADDKTYTAKFTTYYTVSAETGTDGGTVSGGGKVANGGSITLNAAANDGYIFDGWYDGDTKVCDTAEFTVSNVTADKTYTAKFTKNLPPESHLFSTNETGTLLTKIKNDGVTDIEENAIVGVHFVNLTEYDLTDVKYSDYSADGDESVKAWMDGTDFYIGGYEKIIAGESLVCAFCGGEKINSITGLDMLDTSKVTDMKCMFDACGYSSTVFTLNLGDKFDTSNVTDMSNMFGGCGRSSTVFTLDLGDKFDTAKVTDMCQMFDECGYNSNAFTALDLSSFTISADTSLSSFAPNMPVTTFIFGEGWANASLPTAGSETGDFYADGQISTTVTGATANLINYDWAGDNRTVTFTDKNYYTIMALADDGGTVSGGGTVVESGKTTLTATADDGYTFDGWYDGDAKVCYTAEFTVKNVTEDKTYTAKFTKNQVDPEPEPEEPDVPYLKWDGSTLALVKKADASCRVGIVYVGGATFDADNISWDELVAAGKEYANLNSPIGYAVYNNFTKRTPGTRGNYVAFVKYTKDDGTTTADYITYTVKDAVSFEVPALSYNTKTKSLKMKGNVSSTIGIAYVGDEEFNTSNITWNDFVKAGKKYSDINGDSGYAKVLNTLDYTKTFDNNGNYAAFIKYFDENLKKTIAKYYTFTVSDYDSQPTDAPFAVAEENKIILTANGLNVNKVTIVYIGTEDMYISNWNEFSAAAAKFSDINGKSLNQQYTNPKDGSAWEQDTDGWYAVYIRYLKDDKTYNSYYTVEIN